MSNLTLHHLGLAVLACSASPDEATLYARASALAPDQPLEAAELCEQLDERLAAECLALTAAEVASRDPEQGVALCDRVQVPVWRDECRFLLVDAALEHRPAAEAASGCRRAGRFAASCLMHAWQAHARVCRDEASDLEQAAAAFEPSLGWADGVLVVDEPLRDSFWNLFFGVWVDSLEQVDMRTCDGVEGSLGRRCQRAQPGTLQRALNRAERRGLDRDLLCSGGPLPDRVAQSTGVSFVPHPHLDVVAERFAARHCPLEDR